MTAGGRLAACTVASRNYLAYARVLAESWLEHHPGALVTVVLLDADPASVGWQDDRVEIVTPIDLGIPSDELHRMAGIYGAAELAIACKPWAMRHLLGRADIVCYFDGDIEVLAPLDDAVAAAADGVVLTPHSLHPLPPDGRLPGTTTILLAGIYNAGFLALSANDGGFLDWWTDVLRRDCIHDLERGLHGDQRWLDFVPSYFPHVVLRDPTCNVAYWNLHERPVTWDGDRLTLEDGRPVRFFHYSGLSAQAPWRLSQYEGDEPRTPLVEAPAVARLTRAWARRLEDAGRAEDEAHPYRFATTAGGLPLDTRSRRIYRDALLAFEAGNGPEPPGPFDGDGSAFQRWLLGTDDGRPISRYVRRIYDDSPFLQGMFPTIGRGAGSGSDADGSDAFLRWLAADCGQVAAVPEALLAALDLDPEPLEEFPMTPEPDPFTEEAPGPLDRTTEPLPQVAAVHERLARPAEQPGRVRAVLAPEPGTVRDDRLDEVASLLAAAVAELQERVALLGSALERAVSIDLPTHAVRLSVLEETAAHEEKARHDLAGEIDALAERLRVERERIDGALEMETITANIVGDTEQRMLAQLAELRRRLDGIAPPSEH